MAKLDLSYCEVRSEIDGFVSNRNVNPGNRVETDQADSTSSDRWCGTPGASYDRRRRAA
jgi:multidrug efflux pump subunit AcrA (membrane-fusion protein)